LDRFSFFYSLFVIFLYSLVLKIYNEKILVVDDELSIRQILETRLSIRGYEVFLAANGEDALSLFKKEQPNLVILDIMLPKIDGYEVCTEIRKESQVPIIMLTALGDISDRVMGLELGADDYVMKPFSPKELEARIRSVLRRSENQIIPSLQTSNKSILQIGNLAIDTNKRQVFKGKKRIRLTGMEFNLLELLINKAGERLSRSMILDRVWGYTPERYVDTRVVDVHISRLRSKLEEDPSNPDLIITARGTGYMFQNYQNNTFT
jgi:OmpR family response regulator RpaB